MEVLTPNGALCSRICIIYSAPVVYEIVGLAVLVVVLLYINAVLNILLKKVFILISFFPTNEPIFPSLFSLSALFTTVTINHNTR